MQIFAVNFTRRLAGGVSDTSIWLDGLAIDDFVLKIEQALGSKAMRVEYVRVTDVFDTDHYIAMLSWEHIRVRELKGQTLKNAVDQITVYHTSVSPDGKVVDISRRAGG